MKGKHSYSGPHSPAQPSPTLPVRHHLLSVFLSQSFPNTLAFFYFFEGTMVAHVHCLYHFRYQNHSWLSTSSAATLLKTPSSIEIFSSGLSTNPPSTPDVHCSLPYLPSQCFSPLTYHCGTLVVCIQTLRTCTLLNFHTEQCLALNIMAE